MKEKSLKSNLFEFVMACLCLYVSVMYFLCLVEHGKVEVISYTEVAEKVEVLDVKLDGETLIVGTGKTVCIEM